MNTALFFFALVSVALNVVFVMRELKHQSFVADVEGLLKHAEQVVATDAKSAKAKLANALAGLKAKL